MDLRSGDALALPLRTEEWGDFDVAHARFVLEHVRDPLGVVRSMVRAVKFGGRIVLEDDDHEVIRLWPEPPGFACCGMRTSGLTIASGTTPMSAVAWSRFSMRQEQSLSGTPGYSLETAPAAGVLTPWPRT